MFDESDRIRLMGHQVTALTDALDRVIAAEVRRVELLRLLQGDLLTLGVKLMKQQVAVLIRGDDSVSPEGLQREIDSLACLPDGLLQGFDSLWNLVSIGWLDLSTRVDKALRVANLITVGTLMLQTTHSLQEHRNIGPRAVEEIRRAFVQRGLPIPDGMKENV